MRIQHNIMAMSAYRNYTNNTSALSKNLEKLSSGYKINRAGDDAAGLAISEKMRAQITGLTAASKNVKDGISLVKTAEGAMQEIHDMLNRMDYLATQSANGTYDNDVDRANLQKEVDALRSEIDRIADSANFNGIKLLDGSLEAKIEGAIDTFSETTKGGAVLNVLNDGRMSAVATKGVYEVDLSQLVITNNTNASKSLTKIMFGTKAATFSKITISKSGGTTNGSAIGQKLAAKYTGAATSSTLTIDGIGYKVTHAGGGKIKLEMTKVPTKLSTKALSVALGTQVTSASTTPDSNIGNVFSVVTVKSAVPTTGRIFAHASLTLTSKDVVDGATMKIGDTTYTFAVGKDSQFKGAPNVIDLTDTSATEKDFVSKAVQRLAQAAAGNKQFIVTSDNVNSIDFNEREGGIDYAVNNLAGKASVSGDGDWTGLIQMGTRKPGASGGLTLQIGDTADSFNQMRVSVSDMHTAALGIGGYNGIDISTQDGATAAIDKIKKAINSVSSTRGDLGAVQNRLEHTQNNLSVMTENIQDAESTIRDTDVADEMMKYTKNNILIQSAQAMLAQANQVPQGVLQLLQ